MDNYQPKENKEIKKALIEFEEKYAEESGSMLSKPEKSASETPKVVAWVMNHSRGHMKQKQAEYLLFGFAGLTIIFSLFLAARSRPETKEPPAYLVEQAGSPADFLP